jgi:hypothetical protein
MMSGFGTSRASQCGDGARLLVARRHCDDGYDNRQAQGGTDRLNGVVIIREHVAPSCRPVESIVASLHDLETGNPALGDTRDGLPWPQLRQSGD